MKKVNLRMSMTPGALRPLSSRGAAKRAGEIEELLAICNQLRADDLPPSSPIQAGALVELELNGKTKTVFLLPKGGGNGDQS